MNQYEIVKAANHIDALNKTKFKVGSLARITEVNPIANADGTFSVFPIYELLTKEEQDEIKTSAKG